MRGTYHIVVGVDGSDGGRRALGWAIHEAQARRGTVQAITAWRWDTVGSGPGEAATVAQAQARAERILDEEVGALSTSAGVAIAAEAVEGRAAPVLTAAARDADLLVLGSHGHSEVYHTVLGSVAEECVRHASCPVVVVPVASDQAAPVRDPARR